MRGQISDQVERQGGMGLYGSSGMCRVGVQRQLAQRDRAALRLAGWQDLTMEPQPVPRQIVSCTHRRARSHCSSSLDRPPRLMQPDSWKDLKHKTRQDEKMSRWADFF